ncbi:alpha/beta hydrolase [Flavobacterium pectinovorum]|uniref:alpha/beta hydrolase n=1 Tax=Flavobacterium pectinovorum TaxID=29533 RepID=UPI001FAD8D9F|nr:alpha/beta fold hydrolase [Flavobacterium pectinovorum]MCI9846543.1 alpha/beta hydrolase [Flavobacterium pectinovorum]
MKNNRVYFITKIIILIISLIPASTLYGQKSYDFEKEIEHPENYNFREINFVDLEDNITLSGTLIFPKIEYSKIVIIVPGSGKDTRNSHYVLAEELLKNSIAVYRFDDRGVGKSGGTVNFSVDQIIQDLYYALDNIKKTDTLAKKQIGVLGHSLGGIATIDVYQKSLNMDFIVLMSTPVEKYGRFNHLQFLSKSNPKIKTSAKTVFENLNIPLLFISGTNDSFFDSEKTISLLTEINNKNISTEILQGQNHFLRKGTDNWKKTKEYNNLYQIDNQTLDRIVSWIKKI